MGKRKKKSEKTSVKKQFINPMELFRSLRKPHAPSTKVLKDKKQYTRKKKHKKDYREEE